MSKPVLYEFIHSVWSMVPILAINELGYKEGDIDEKQVNLVAGQNFEVDFVKINSKATLPTLVVPGGQVFTDTTSVTKWIVDHAPNAPGKASGTDLIVKVHEDRIDGNFALLAARSQGELDAKNAGVPGLFVRGRQATLERVAPTAPAEFEEFYKGKLGFNGFVSSIYAPDAAAEAKAAWFAKSQEHWATINSFILNELPAYLPESGFVGGDKPGEDDFHVGAWLGRTVLLVGGNPAADGINPLEKALGAPIPAKVRSYWEAWSERPSWKKTYEAGLH